MNKGVVGDIRAKYGLGDSIPSQPGAVIEKVTSIVKVINSSRFNGSSNCTDDFSKIKSSISLKLILPHVWPTLMSFSPNA